MDAANSGGAADSTPGNAAERLPREKRRGGAGAREARQLRAVAASGTGVWEADPNSEAVGWSDALKAIFGVPADTRVTWTSRMQYVHPDDRAELTARLQQAMASGGEYHSQYRIIRPDGALRWLESYGRGEYDARGRLLRMVGVARDITQAKQAEIARQASERRFRALVESISQIVWFADESGKLTEILTPLSGTLAVEPNRATGDQWVNVLHPDDVAGAVAAWSQAVATGRPYSTEFRLRMRDGRYRYFAAQAVLLETPDGGAREWIGIGTDIDDRKRAEQALEASEQKLGSILGYLTDVVWSISGETNQLVYLGPALEQLAGRPNADFLADPELWFRMIHPDEREHVRRAVARFYKQGTLDVEYRFQRPDGTWRWARNRGTAIFGADGRVIRGDGVVSDITDRKRQEERIIRLSRLHAVHAGIDTLIVRTRNRRELFEGACRIAVDQGQFKVAWCGVRSGEEIQPVAWGGARNSCLEQHARISLGRDRHWCCGAVAAILNEKLPCVSNDIASDPCATGWVQAANSLGIRSWALFPLVVRGQLVGALGLYAGETGFFDAEETRLCSTLAADIAYAMEFIQHKEELEFLAYYDSLTGLPNRYRFTEELERQMAAAAPAGQRLAVIVIDLANFKSVNDALGVAAGDRVLRRAARRLRRIVGEPERLARLGSDRFAVVVPAIDEAAGLAAILGDPAYRRWNRPYRVRGQELRIAPRMGVALFPDDGATAESLIQNAESALKRAKASGDRYLHYTEEMGAVFKSRLRLESDLRAALDRSEFVVHYQPQVDLRSGAICGAEALLRWDKPGAGLVPPGKFIAALEETGLIVDVGRRVLRQAAEDSRRWRAQGLRPLRVSVNVSPLQLRQPGFVAEFAAAVGSAPDAGIDLEVTESLLMADAQGAIDKLRQLQSMDVRVAIDDFGTGYSSLAYLSKLPVSTLKIDRSFIVAMTEKAANMGIVSTIIALAQSMNLRVVAEGVESPEQLKFLRLLRCHEIQGFLFSPAVPADTLAQMLREGRML
ncbi:MAG: EAL domain-containing protein [Nevskia sp.]|nr:EAL domain-containing protein [Nevskia sp.]